MIRRFISHLVDIRYRRKLTAAGHIGRDFKYMQSTRFINHAGPDAIVIGDHVTLLDSELTCYSQGRISIGHHCWISLRGQIISNRSVTIGNYCIIARDVYISDTNEHPLDPIVRRRQTIAYLERDVPPDRLEADAAPVTIGNDVWIGERAIILKGVEIGDGAIVAAGAVVSRPVEPGWVVAGNPARPVKKIQPPA